MADQPSGELSKNAQKKAAKKAAKQAAKQGGGAPPQGAAKPVNIPPKKPISLPLTKLSPLQLSINPNHPLVDRPVVALSVAILTNTVIDYTIVSDHRRAKASLGLEEGETIVGDIAMARYVARRAGNVLPRAQQALVDQWVEYASSLSLLDDDRRLRAITMTLHKNCAERTYLVGHQITLADLALFALLGFPTQAGDFEAVLGKLHERATVAKRWITMMASHPALQEATQLAIGIANNAEAVFDATCTVDPLVSGMNPLQGAIPGRVVTRFPPEPSGYLHIGHAKAALLNDYYAKRYKGRLLLRFDDTNPSKEKEEYQDSIVVDLAKLGIVPDTVTYTSDYFDTIYGYAKTMIQKGLAFMDDTPKEQMQEERTARIESQRRNQTSKEALQFFELMCSGAPEGAAFCLRAKIDMKNDNGTLRDPVLFRQNLEPHHRSGGKYKAYPTYDFACPIVDSIEGVTHALRTTEYNDRDAQYQWIQSALGLRRSRNNNFSRVNFTNTVLSKRKLTWFVEQGHVTGWDDPRFPTVRGVVRRGVHIDALRNFMTSQGASKNIVNMDWSTFWGENKKEIDKNALRYMAIDKANNVELTVSNGPADDSFEYLETACHPKDASLGTRPVRLARKVLLEAVDTEGIEVGEEIVLIRWGVVKITKVDGGLEGEFLPDGDFKAAKRKISWIASVKEHCPIILKEFDHYLITKDKLDEGDDVASFLNPNTEASTEAIGDALLKCLKEGDIIQLERRGYYRVDRAYTSKDKPIVLFMVPDGKSKAMSGLAGKLAHR